VKGGKIVGMLKDVAYQIRTPDFWNSIDMIGGKRELRARRVVLRRQGPARAVNAVSHGCPPAPLQVRST
jgi:TldD protein